MFKHNYRTYLEPFCLAILCEDLHSRNDCFSEEKLKINWLEQSEEDPLVYNEGNFDDQNSPKCIMDRVSVDPNAKQFILRRNEERRLKNLGNGQVTMRARKRRILEKWKTKSLVAEPGLRLDAVDLGEESPDIFFKYTFLHFQPQFHYCNKMEKLKITIMRLQVAEMKY